MTYELDVSIPGLPPMQNALKGHWRTRAKQKKVWESLVFWTVRDQIPKEPLQRARVTIVRNSSSEPDYDNLVAGGKFILDGLTYAGVIVDDKQEIIGRPTYDWKYAPPKKGFVRVQVREVEA